MSEKQITQLEAETEEVLTSERDAKAAEELRSDFSQLRLDKAAAVCNQALTSTFVQSEDRINQLLAELGY
jgi:hypothetical protein